MDEVGSSIFGNLTPTIGANGDKISFFGAKKITFSQCEDTTKIYTNKFFVYFICILCISSINIDVFGG